MIWPLWRSWGTARCSHVPADAVTVLIIMLYIQSNYKLWAENILGIVTHAATASPRVAIEHRKLHTTIERLSLPHSIERADYQTLFGNVTRSLQQNCSEGHARTRLIITFDGNAAKGSFRSSINHWNHRSSVAVTSIMIKIGKVNDFVVRHPYAAAGSIQGALIRYHSDGRVFDRSYLLCVCFLVNLFSLQSISRDGWPCLFKPISSNWFIHPYNSMQPCYSHTSSRTKKVVLRLFLTLVTSPNFSFPCVFSASACFPASDSNCLHFHVTLWKHPGAGRTCHWGKNQGCKSIS